MIDMNMGVVSCRLMVGFLWMLEHDNQRESESGTLQ